MERERTAEAVVVGGGVVGASIAFHLARRGLDDVILLEKESLASGATGICPGGIRQQFSSRSDCLLARSSFLFWDRINEILEPEQPFRFEKSGYLFLADSEAQLEAYRRNTALHRSLGIPSEMVDPAAIGRLLPKLRLDSVVGGSFCGEDGFLEDCHGVTAELARTAARSGARIFYEEALAIEPSPAGWRVATNRGKLESRRLALAAGCACASLTAPLGISLPVVELPRRLAFSAPFPEQVMAPLVAAPERGFAGKQLEHGVFYFGWLRETPQLDDLDFLEKALRAGAALLPLFADLPVRRILRGVYDQTPDSRPILGPVKGLPGLFLACGFSGHGFMIAPAVGDALARCMLGKDPEIPLDDFSLQRFEGSPACETLVI